MSVAVKNGAGGVLVAALALNCGGVSDAGLRGEGGQGGTAAGGAAGAGTSGAAGNGVGGAAGNPASGGAAGTAGVAGVAGVAGAAGAAGTPGMAAFVDPTKGGPYSVDQAVLDVSVAATNNAFKMRCFVPKDGPTVAPYPLVIMAHGFQLDAALYDRTCGTLRHTATWSATPTIRRRWWV